MRVAYFTNQYPAVSHTFIRREIKAVESLGVTVFRYALRPGKGIVDQEDLAEERQTRYIVRAGPVEVLRCCIIALLTQPLAVGRVTLEALNIGRRSKRGLFLYIIYASEAIVLARWCRRDRVDHIHAHFGTNATAIAMLAGSLSGIPYSFTSHGPDEYEEAEWLSLDVKVERAAFVATVSSYGRSQLMRWSAFDQWPKISIVHCGVDKSFLGTAIPFPSAPRLVCVARFGPEKAQLLLISAARRLRDAGVDFEILLAGDGKMRVPIQEAIRQAGLQRHINLTGWISGERVRAEITRSRALVVPSFAENLPVAIMEALALGRPVISTHVAGIPELVQPGVTGWLVPPGDEIALAAAMRAALEAPIDQLAAMGAAGRSRISLDHDALVEARKLKKLFASDNPNGAAPSVRCSDHSGTS